ncbi:hypothetical protein [Paludibacterium denitrificans]|uniref:hypothetical protein n=1 Tax=Paludibacterium denitrificans TaxID=2675226 RepID=UPI001E29D864|nr:hypothetical protein [Paludibacterium denitrificans]
MQDAANRLLQRLGTALKQEMSTHGPVAAIGVCKDLAPQLAGELSRENGWKVTRVSLKVRNPMLGLPDASGTAAIAEFRCPSQERRRSRQPATRRNHHRAGAAISATSRPFPCNRCA